MHADPTRSRRGRRRLAAVAAASLLLASCLAVVYGSIPAFGDGPIGPADAWTFDVLIPGTVTLEADSDGPDLVLDLYDATGRYLTSGDDEIPCSSTLPCGFQCPRIETSLPTGSYFVVVRDFGAAAGCPGGTYTMTIRTPGGDRPLDMTQVLNDEPVETPDGRTPSKG